MSRETIKQDEPLAQVGVQEDAVHLINANEAQIAPYYKLAAILLVTVLTVHIAVMSYLVLGRDFEDLNTVLGFIVFSASMVVVEVVTGRFAIMLASRIGQLKDIRLIIAMVSGRLTPRAFEDLARGLGSLRRDKFGTLKIVDVESLIASLAKKTAKLKDDKQSEGKE